MLEPAASPCDHSDVYYDQRGHTAGSNKLGEWSLQLKYYLFVVPFLTLPKHQIPLNKLNLNRVLESSKFLKLCIFSELNLNHMF